MEVIRSFQTVIPNRWRLFQTDGGYSVIPNGHSKPMEVIPNRWRLFGHSERSFQTDGGYSKPMEVIRSFGQKSFRIPEKAMEVLMEVIRSFQFGHSVIRSFGHLVIPIRSSNSGVGQIISFEFGGTLSLRCWRLLLSRGFPSPPEGGYPPIQHHGTGYRGGRTPRDPASFRTLTGGPVIPQSNVCQFHYLRCSNAG